MRRLALPLVLLAACGAEPKEVAAPTESAAAPLTAATFCAAYAEHMCAANASCACEVDDVCVARMKKSCDDRIVGPDVYAALDEGVMAFDAERAAGVLHAIDATDCREPFAALEWKQKDLVGFGGAFVGRRRVGEACSIPFFAVGPNECDGGVCVADGASFKCVAVAAVGEACGLNTPRGEVRCLEADAPVARVHLGPERLFGPCIDGVCAPRQHDDAPCARDGWCQSGRCEQLRRPTTSVEVHVDLDRFARESSGAFLANDPSTYQYRLTTRIVDRHGEPRSLQLYLFRGTETEWGYSAMVDGEVVAVGALAFSDDGALEVDYPLTGVSFEAGSSLGPIAIDFGASVAEGGSGFAGTHLVDDRFGVRRLEGDQVESTPFCAARLLVGSECGSDVECASGVCGGEGSRPVCQPADRAFGAECGSDGECASGACVSGSCAAGWCG